MVIFFSTCEVSDVIQTCKNIGEELKLIFRVDEKWPKNADLTKNYNIHKLKANFRNFSDIEFRLIL
jgi:hypothetical protein